MFYRFTARKDDKKFISMVSFFENIVNFDQRGTYTKKNLESPFKFDFDLFYICLILGLNYNLKEELSNFETGPKNIFYGFDYFPDAYKDVGNLINPLILATIAEDNKIDTNDKQLVRNLINENVIPANLSKNLLNLLNQYSAGGYMKLIEEFNYVAPRGESCVINFLIKFNKLMSKE